MTQQDRALWLPSALALLLLWVPGSLSLSGPRTVTGTVGGSLSVQCRYEEQFRKHIKYWCDNSCSSLTSKKIVETTRSEREVRRGHVSIRDDPANLTFTVTLDSLTEEDGASTSTSPTSIIRATTSTVTAQIPTVCTVCPAVNATHSANSQEHVLPPSQGWGLHVLLSFLGVLLLLLGGTSLLAWRMVRRRSKARENLEPLQDPSQDAQLSEPCYADLELLPWPVLEEPVQPRQTEVEYSTVGPCKDNLHYSSVVFNHQSQDSKDNPPSQKPQLEETEYSVIRA
ncbi:CMRF35-like molecule 8 isoform X2 [Rhinolophus sinicus]|uniref:CMRF35-like molecule 8 isoform X2 n=1 Tax=Rhinolophus sinicus TaxID=89399 RepID=UPI003D7B1A2E